MSESAIVGSFHMNKLLTKGKENDVKRSENEEYRGRRVADERSRAAGWKARFSRRSAVEGELNETLYLQFEKYYVRLTAEECIVEALGYVD